MINGFSSLHTGLYSKEAYIVLKMALLLHSFIRRNDRSSLVCSPKTDGKGRLTLKFFTNPMVTPYLGSAAFIGGCRSDFIKRNPDGELVILSKARSWTADWLIAFRELLKNTIERLSLREDTLFWPTTNFEPLGAGDEPPFSADYAEQMKQALACMMFIKNEGYGNYIYEDVCYEKLVPLSFRKADMIVECFLRGIRDADPCTDQFLIEQRVLCYETAKKFFDELYKFVRETSEYYFFDEQNGSSAEAAEDYHRALSSLLTDEQSKADEVYAAIELIGKETGSLESLMSFEKFKEGHDAFKMKTAFSAVPNIIQLAHLADTFL